MDYQKYYNIMLDIISDYKDLENLYKEKQQLLVKNKINDLATLDAKIIERAEHIRVLNEQRIEIVGEVKLSEVIERAKEDKSMLLEDFGKIEVKLDELKRSIVLLEQSNVELIKHGIVMTDKTINIIASAFTPSANYNCAGKNENQDVIISSVVEEV